MAGQGRRQRWWPMATLGLLGCVGVLTGSQLEAAPALQSTIGSPVVASAEPPVSRPVTKPCVVSLLKQHAFDEHGDAASMAAHPYEFEFTPPQACPKGWGKVVLDADFSVPAGRQFDRTVALWIGGINLYFGTTIEPSPDVAQHWHVERDLTDYASLFTRPQSGQMILNNWVSPTTNSPIVVSLRLKFYPTDDHSTTTTADHVYGLSSGARGEQTPLNTPKESLSRQFTFPRNVKRAYLDVIAQSQSHDERWYTCVDKAYLEKTRAYSLEGFEACDGGSFRGVEVQVDGQPAGLAPVYPWIFTGGIAPHLWLPTPGLQTVNFIPFRVDLTPFAGLLDDGKPHTVGVRVVRADQFFNVSANLLVYRDHQRRQLSGSVVRNTLANRQPAGLVVVRNTLHAGPRGGSEGTVNTDLAQSYVVAGHLHTARGTITTTVRYHGSFRNHQTFRQPAAKRYVETIDQLTSVSLAVDRSLNGHPLDGYTLQQHDPLHVSVDKSVVTKGQDFTALVAMKQAHQLDQKQTDAHGPVYYASLQESLSTRDHADGQTIPDPLGRSDFAHHEQGAEQISFIDSFGSCYQADIASRDERLTSRTEGQGCPSHANHLDSRSRPDSPTLAPLSKPL